ncbi:MAG: hypothetical protein WCO11_11290 [Sphingomonadales bacterium]|jgi:hypothetical protein
MKLSAKTLEDLSDATGISRETIRSTFSEIGTVLGDRLDSMRQRVAGIMANARSSGSNAGIDEVMDYADGSLTPGEKLRIFAALGLGCIGGFLLASAAGSIVTILVGLALLILSGQMLISMYRSITQRLSTALEVF